MKNKINFKVYIALAFSILALNTQGIFLINYYFPGTILCSMTLLVYFLMESTELKEKIMWIFIPTLVYWISGKALEVTGVGGSFFTFIFIPLFSLMVLGLLTKKIIISKSWKTFLILFALWFLDIIWTAVAYKQAMNSATRIYHGGSPEEELSIVNRFFLGVVYAIEICSILSLIEFTQEKKNVQKM